MLSAFGRFNQLGGGGGVGAVRFRPIQPVGGGGGRPLSAAGGGGGGLISAVDGGCCPLSANSASGGAHVSKHRYFESMM